MATRTCPSGSIRTMAASAEPDTVRRPVRSSYEARLVPAGSTEVAMPMPRSRPSARARACSARRAG